MADQDPARKAPPWGRGAILAVAAAAMVGTAALTALLVNIMERKQEAKNPFFRVVELTDETEDPDDLGQELPDPVRRLQAHGRPEADALRRQRGDAAARRPRPTPGRSSRSPGSRRTRGSRPCGRATRSPSTSAKKRGHAYMLEDQTYTERVQEFKQPGTCIHCHASVYVPYKKAGGGDLVKGFEHFNQMPYTEARKSCQAPGRLHRLPRPADHGAAHHPARLPRGHQGAARRARASPTTTSTRRRRARRCAASSAASATSSTTSRAPRSGSPTPGTRG